MLELEPVRPSLLAYYREKMDNHLRMAFWLRRPHFSNELKDDLNSHLGDDDAVSLIEIVTRMGDFADAGRYTAMRKAVASILKSDPVKARRGKRPAPGLVDFVGTIAPLLLHFGLPMATSERSKLVLCLRMIATEVGVPGDPREELRRLVRLEERARLLNDRAMKEIREAVRLGLLSDDCP